MTSIEASTDPLLQRYVQATPASRRHYEVARAVVPAGVTRSVNAWAPYPIYARRGRGPLVWDLDGRTYVDFLNNYTANVLGHAHPRVVEAVVEAAQAGTSFAFATELEARLAGMIVDRVPSVERVRFTGSGTEAAMFAVRLARTATGRRKVAKMEGGFHGAYDDLSVSVRPPLDRAGPQERPVPVRESRGLGPRVLDDVVILPFNRLEDTVEVIRDHADELAAVIVEPVLGLGGVLPPVPGYLAGLRAACSRHGVLLIFDEVVTLRLGPGGAQGLFGVVPDLTVMGKIIGGGLPVGAYGGAADLMALLESRGGHDPSNPRMRGPRLSQGGTFTGTPLTLAAGIATLEEMTPEAYARLNEAGEEVRARMTEVAAAAPLPATVTGIGSLFNVHLCEPPIEGFRDTRRTRARLQHRFFLSMLLEGVMLAPRGMGSLSTAMTAEHLDRFVAAAARSFESLAEAGAGDPRRAAVLRAERGA
jgi:glutamate-1-semialdehyde 2,1-aminomutase